ncbi:MAG: hypothetical protein EXS16_08050 [Gemmataceae bacterium]|nr:hypothetical protein [Gemmataceae bacterium]
MIAIVLPSDIAESVEHAALAKGITPEMLAIETLRQQFPPVPQPIAPSEPKNLFEYLAGYIGTVEGTGETNSRKGGELFADYLVEKHRKVRKK